MPITLHGRTLERVGVIGSGNIGPDIALHFARALAPRGVDVVVVDISEEALEAGRARATRKVDKQLARGKLQEPEARAVLDALFFTTDYDSLKGAGLVVEAASENLEVKRSIYHTLESILAPEAVIASNTSHLPPDEIFADLTLPERALVAHYFFPAERNPVVELVSGARTSPDAVDLLETLYEETGKIPIRLSGRYGFAVNPVFEGMFQAAALIVEAGWADPMQVDAVACDVLGYGVGPFTAMNLTGGNPLTAAALPEYGRRLSPWFRTPESLAARVASGEPWPVAARGAEVRVPDAVRQRVGDALLGAYFGLVGEILDSGIIDLGSLELAVSTALAVQAPFALMNRLGPERALELVEAYAASQQDFGVPDCLRKQAAAGVPWDIPVVLRRDLGDVALVQIRRPAALGALNTAVFDQLEAHLDAAAQDPAIAGVVVTGFGPRAFAAGADIKELVTLPDAAALEAKSRRGQAVFRRIETLGKPVVAAMNGLAFGGGLELCLACTARLGRSGQSVFAAQPEPKLGVIPGYGGTQRLPRLVGLEAAWPLLRTGEPISSARALEIGLIDAEVAGTELRATAVAWCRELAQGSRTPRPKGESPIAVPDPLPQVDIGPLSRVIDEILCEVVLSGARTTLERGLDLEARAFGRCYETEDFHIGMRNFLEHGARSKAPFVHR